MGNGTRQRRIRQLRRVLAQVFDDTGLEAFCQDYFLDVSDQFGTGMRRDTKITLLLGYCRCQPGGLAALEQALRTSQGPQILAAPEEPDSSTAEGDSTHLTALLLDHRGFIQDRLAHFVGRAAELAAVRERIAALEPTGGYLTITGRAGQGKSSVIARLVADAGVDHTLHHFIPLNPGPDHQVSLLRNLLARILST